MLGPRTLLPGISIWLCLGMQTQVLAESHPEVKQPNQITVDEVRNLKDQEAVELKKDVLVAVIKTSKDPALLEACAQALRKASSQAVKDTLIKAACDDSLTEYSRSVVLRALSFHANAITEEEFQTLLEQGDDILTVTNDLACKVKVNRPTIELILSKFSEEQYQVVIVQFCGQQLTLHTEEDDARIKTRDFLYQCAASLEKYPIRVQTELVTALDKGKLAGGAEVAIGILRQLKDKQDGDPMASASAEFLHSFLKRATGLTMDEEKGGNTPSGSALSEKWIRWWEDAKHKKEFILPVQEDKAQQ